MRAGSVRILFVIRALQHYYYFKSIVEALSLLGCEIKVLFDKESSTGDLSDLKKVSTSRVIYSWAPRSPGKLHKLLFYLRNIVSWRRYLIFKDQSEFYRNRWEKFYLFPGADFALKIPLVRQILATILAAETIKKFEGLVFCEKEVLDEISSFNPDVVLASPANFPFSSADIEYLKAAKKLKIPTALPVFSWDNLTTKGLIHFVPDLLLAWNNYQREEALKFHKIPNDKIRIVGSPLFDDWFLKKEKNSQAEFCKKYLLDARKPVITFLESSESLTGDERFLVREIVNSLAKSRNEKLKQTQVIVRPHPFKSYFKNFSYKNIFVIPRKETWPDSTESINTFYESLSCSLAVVGINTTGLINAAICNRPIISFDLEKYKLYQLETVHFRQLLDFNLVEMVRDTSDFINILEKILKNPGFGRERRKKFIEEFIRPGGLGKTAGERAADEIMGLVKS